MFSAIYNWFFPCKNSSENGLDNEIQYERARRLPFTWKCKNKCDSSKNVASESISVIKKNKQKLSKIHCESENLILRANEYANHSKSLSNKIKD
jgi:hypothetical protein